MRTRKYWRQRTQELEKKLHEKNLVIQDLRDELYRERTKSDKKGR